MLKRFIANAFILSCWPMIRQGLILAEAMAMLEGREFDWTKEMADMFPITRYLVGV